MNGPAVLRSEVGTLGVSTQHGDFKPAEPCCWFSRRGKLWDCGWEWRYCQKRGRGAKFLPHWLAGFLIGEIRECLPPPFIHTDPKYHDDARGAIRAPLAVRILPLHREV